MTEAEARKILINKSLTGTFTNSECDALSVLFREVEHLQRWKSEVIEDFCRYDGNNLDEVVENARNKVIDEFSELIKEKLKGMQMAQLQGEDICPCAETGEECPYINQDIGCQYCAREQTVKDIDEIAEQMKEGDEV